MCKIVANVYFGMFLTFLLLYTMIFLKEVFYYSGHYYKQILYFLIKLYEYKKTKQRTKFMKKILSSILVIILMLLQLSTNTFAQTQLSRREFVEKYMEPKSKHTKSDTFSEEEWKEILDFAQKMGITLTEEEKKPSSPIYKIEYIRYFLYPELGVFFYWSIEDQAWYENLMVKYGLLKSASRVLPKKGENTEEETLAIATQYIKENFQVEVSIGDTASHTFIREYRQTIEKKKKTRLWSIILKANSPTLDSYFFTISPKGEILEFEREIGIHNPNEVAPPDVVWDYYIDTYGLPFHWTQEIWEQRQKDLRRSVAAHPDVAEYYNIVFKQEYVSQQDSPLPKEKAIESCLQALSTLLDTDLDEIKQKFQTNALLLKGSQGLVWKIGMVQLRPNPRIGFLLYHAEVVVSTGQVQNLMEATDGVMNAFYLIGDNK